MLKIFWNIFISLFFDSTHRVVICIKLCHNYLILKSTYISNGTLYTQSTSKYLTSEWKLMKDGRTHFANNSWLLKVKLVVILWEITSLLCHGNFWTIITSGFNDGYWNDTLQLEKQKLLAGPVLYITNFLLKFFVAVLTS